MKLLLSLALVAASVAVGGVTYVDGASAAGYCQGVPPSEKFICCQKHPRAAACR
jgi:hypothetical protein